MAKISTCSIAIFALCSCIAFEKSFAKPAELQVGPDPVPSVTLLENVDESAGSEVKRDQRSSQDQFDYGDDYDVGSRHYKHHHKPHGCRKHGGHGCGGYHHKPSHSGGSGSFASASAGSGSGYHGGSSQSQAEAASLSLGPISISAAHAVSSSKGNRHGGYGGYGGYGGNGGYGGYGGYGGGYGAYGDLDGDYY